MSNAPISRPIDDIAASYEAIVIGSGYGAGVAASRLARAGQKVCVIERGREIRPGAYPKHVSDARTDFQFATPHGRVGRADAMFQLHTNDDVFALVGCGLGGTSLINANVGLEVDRAIFKLKHWPQPYQDDPELLAPFYATAREMLDISPYPDDWPELGKLKALEEAAQVMGARFERTPIAVNFKDRVNRFGVTQPACTNCGDCCSGCNVGAKNTTLMNYLPDAANHGAQIFNCGRVDWIEKAGNGYRVHYTRIVDGEPGEQGVVEAPLVVVGAGTLGSTQILQNSKAKGLSLSGQLGNKFSGNGDVLAFGFDAYRTMQGVSTRDEVEAIPKIYSIGIGANTVAKSAYPGPCITGVITVTGDKPLDTLIVQDGATPGPVSSMVPAAFFFADALAGGFARCGSGQAAQRLFDAKDLGTAVTTDLADLVERSYMGSVARSQAYLVMSFDDDGGVLLPDENGIRIQWSQAGTSETIRRDNSVIQDVCDAVAAQFFPNPIWTEAMGYKIITVHPLGGCSMGDDATNGVVDERCRVFAGAEGTEVHHGLYVCDGSVMPGGIGVNPLLTITAVSERALSLMIADLHLERAPGAAKLATVAATAAQDEESIFDKAGDWIAHKVHDVAETVEDAAEATLKAIDGDLAGLFHKLMHLVEEGEGKILRAALDELLSLFGEEIGPTWSFTETMSGHLGFDLAQPVSSRVERIADEFDVAAGMGRHMGTECSFELTIRSENLHRMLADPLHQASISGTVTIPHLTTDPIKVEDGVFRLLMVDPDTPEQWLMTYDMQLDAPGGPYRFHGAKTLHKRHGSNPWADLTTLFVTLTGPHEKVRARGILTLGVDQLLKQMTTMKLERQDNWESRVLAKFPRVASAIDTDLMGSVASLFATSVFQTYGGLLANLADFEKQDEAKEKLRPLDAPAPFTVRLRTPDDFSIQLTRYNGGAKGPVLLAPGFSVKASSFATTTVDKNLVEFLTADNYDVWLFDYRASGDAGNPTEPGKIRPFSIDDIAMYDWPTAINYVTSYTRSDSVQAMAHCIGSMSLLMGIASGAITKVRSVVSSQLTLHPVTGWMNYVKSDLDLARVLAKVGALHDSFDFVSSTEGDGPEIDTLAYSVPVPAGQECHNPTCHRVFAAFGPSYDHAQLNQATHVALVDMFSAVPVGAFDQIQLIVEAGHAVSAEGKDIYVTPEGAKRLKLPITFLAGANNQIFFPETSALTQAWLDACNPHGAGDRLYHRRLISGYAHMDLFIGKNAARDIFPMIHQALEAHQEMRTVVEA